jgi:antitoxin HicB
LSEYSYTVLFEPMAEGGFQVIVPALPEIVTYGQDLAEAREMARDAIRCVIESNLKEGEPIPKDVEPLSERVSLTLP